VNDLFLIAEIKAIQDSSGYVLIRSFSDFSERFFRLKEVYMDFFGNYKKFVVEKVSVVNGNIALKFKGFDSIDELRIFLNKKIFVDEKDSIQLDKDSFFIHDLVGSKAFRNNELLGSIEDVYLLPANDVYIIKTLDDRRILIPAVKDFVKEFDPIEKRLNLTDDCDLLYDDEN
jgi:16S rRNA processing protein RimM